jgi:hypothetical protein
MEKSKLIVERLNEQMLPLCEMNRSIVVNPISYVSNVVFQVGPLKLIDKAP